MTALIRLALIIRIFTLIFLLLLIGALLQGVLNNEKKQNLHYNYKNDRWPSVHYSFENLTMMSHQDVQRVKQIWEEELELDDAFKKNRSVADGAIEGGGEPERVLLVSSWRSGSSYVGSLIRNRPGTYYFFEPLYNSFENSTVPSDSEHEALDILRNLFQCRDQEGRHTTKSYRDDAFFSRNNQLLAIARHSKLRWDPAFLTVMCRRSTILAMKTVRLTLHQASALLEDNKLNIKIVYLVRDPRATINSRIHKVWCLDRPACLGFSTLCSDLVDNFNVALHLEREYPHRFMVLHYEDVLTRSRTLNQFLNFLNIDPGAFDTLATLAAESQLSKWSYDLSRSLDFVLQIQHVCSKAMELWGYKPISPSL